MGARAAGPTRAQRQVRGVLVAGYAGLAAAGFASEWQPRVFWTMLLPLVPLSIVLMGFPWWRQVCPLAWFGEVGRKLNRGTQRRVPGWLERWFFVVTFAGMLVMLALRLVATNGDGAWLGALLVALAAAALVTNVVYTGKTWCNFLCPVGLVERIYTEPGSLPQTASSSQCVRCTACKKHCPDIDQENAYWRDFTSAGRRMATYAFPGLVLAFYTYYWLRHGDWEAYFDGRWTRIPADAQLVAGPGFFFEPRIPAVAAAVLTLVLFSAASWAAFAALERIAGAFVEDDERRRHLVLALAAFTAFSLFYVFAGAPSLRRLPGGSRAMAFVAPLVATLFLVKRWRRTREHFIRERGAGKLVRNWPFEDPPPADPTEVWAWIKAGEHAREQQLAAYANTVREIIAEGLVGTGELRLLEEIRKQLGITEREHDKVLARLTEEERHLFDRDRTGGIEERTQLASYEAALSEALLRRAAADEVDDLRQAFGVSADDHAAVLERIRGESGTLLTRARDRMDKARALASDLAVLGFPDSPGGRGFLSWLLSKTLDATVRRVLDLVEVSGDADRVRALRPRIEGGDQHTRRAALDQLATCCPGAEDVLRGLEPWILGPVSVRAAAHEDAAAVDGVLRRLAAGQDPYVRAGAVWAATERETLAALVEAAREDSHPLVREAAAAGAAERGDGATVLERMHLLRRVPLLADLDPEDLHDLSRVAEERTVEPPGVLCEQGDPDADELFVVVDGLASVVLRTPAAAGAVPTEREVAVLGVGEVVGELSLLDGSPRSATVRPKDGPLHVLRISGHDFRSRLLPRQSVARPLLVTLSRRMRGLLARRAEEGDRPS